jgi:hypothetical protein
LSRECKSEHIFGAVTIARRGLQIHLECRISRGSKDTSLTVSMRSWTRPWSSKLCNVPRSRFATCRLRFGTVSCTGSPTANYRSISRLAEMPRRREESYVTTWPSARRTVVVPTICRQNWPKLWRNAVVNSATPRQNAHTNPSRQAHF